MSAFWEHLTDFGSFILILVIPASLILLATYVIHRYLPIAQTSVGSYVLSRRLLLYVGALYVPVSLLFNNWLDDIFPVTLILTLHVLLSITGCECAWQLSKLNRWNIIWLLFNAFAGGLYLLLLSIGGLGGPQQD